MQKPSPDLSGPCEMRDIARASPLSALRKTSEPKNSLASGAWGKTSQHRATVPDRKAIQGYWTATCCRLSASTERALVDDQSIQAGTAGGDRTAHVAAGNVRDIQASGACDCPTHKAPLRRGEAGCALGLHRRLSADRAGCARGRTFRSPMRQPRALADLRTRRSTGARPERSCQSRCGRAFRCVGSDAGPAPAARFITPVFLGRTAARMSEPACLGSGRLIPDRPLDASTVSAGKES